jgi:hypothetical protein
VLPEVGKLLAAAAEIAGEKRLGPRRQDGVLRPGGESPRPCQILRQSSGRITEEDLPRSARRATFSVSKTPMA